VSLPRGHRHRAILAIHRAARLSLDPDQRIGASPNSLKLIDKAAARDALPGDLRSVSNRFFRDATGKSQDYEVQHLTDGGYRMQFFVKDLYKGTTNPIRVGSGTTADAVRKELVTNVPTAGKMHVLKAQQYAKALRKLISSHGLDSYDELFARSLLRDIEAALAGN
jgi:hypothetical protein